ncbi:NEN1-like protein, partial [Drosera capensis]
KHHPKPSLLKENKSVSDDNGASRAWILWSRADASRGGLASPQIHQIETVELGGLRSSVSLVGLAPQVRWSTDLEWVDEIYLLDPGVLVLVLDRQDETDRCLPVFLPRPRCPSSYGLRRWISPALIPNESSLEGCSSSCAFFAPDDLFIPAISASLVPFYCGSQRIQILHDNIILKLHCTHLKVRFGISTKFVDHAGRPKLSFVVDGPPKVCDVLDECDRVAQRLFLQSSSTSDWRPLVTRKNGYWNFPTIRIRIPTLVTGEGASYATEIYQKEAVSGAEQKLSFSRFHAAELDALFTPGKFIDAFISLDPFDYQQNAGIRLVAEKVVIRLP